MSKSNTLLNAENAEEFFSSEVHYLKPVLFTKKAETPSLWLRLSEAFGECCKFGEIRHTETALMERFAVSPDALPKIIAVTHDGDGGERVIPYEGPSDFDRISEFLVETGGGRSPALELKRELEMQKREMKSLRQELEREKEALQVARTEIARSKLGQVGQVEAVKKSLEAELAEAKEREKSLRAQVESESRVFSAEIIKLKEEKQLLSDKLMALEAAQGERVVMLNSRNADAFLASTIRPLKAVLFTTKTDVPPLWQQLAEAQSMTTAFGVVRHVEEDVLESFELTAADLPHICIFRGRGRENPVVYDGEVKLEALSSFLRDAVEGGETVIAMRQQMHSAMRQVEHLTEQLEERSRKSKEAEAEAEAEAEEMKRRHEEEMARVVREHQEAIRDVQEQMAKLQQESKKRIRMAEEEVEHMKTEMEAERSAVSKDLQEHLKMMEEEFSAERSRWNMLRELVAQLDSEILLVDRLSRSCEKAVLRASSAVHVTLVRRARETERMQASLREFIDDVAPSQVISAINYGDNQLRAKSLLTSDGESLIESLTTQYKSLKSRINDLDFLGDKRALDLERPSSSSKFVGGKKPERRPEDGESRSVSQRGGSEGISDTLSDTASVRSGSKSSETLSGHKDEEGKSWGEASQRKGGVEDGKMDAAKLQRAKKKQANELVNIAGLDEEISIGRLTREVEKTETKNVFSWRDKRFRLVYDGRVRDRLIDDETGSLVYAYPRWLEEAKIREKSNQTLVGESTMSSSSLGSKDSDVKINSQVDKGGSAKQQEPSKESKKGLSLGKFFFSSSDSKLSPAEKESKRQVSQVRRQEKDRMPALVGGMLVMAPPKESIKGGEEGKPNKSTAHEHESRWSPRTNSSEEHADDLSAEVHEEEAAHAQTAPLSDRDLGAWGRSTRKPVAAPTIWSDEEDVWSSSQLGGEQR